MKVYVASSFRNKDAVRAAIALLVAAGHEITLDWTPTDPGERTGKELLDYCRENAIDDIEKGVKPAEVIIVLHDDRGRGMLVEFGGGLIMGKLVIVIGAPADPMAQVFYTLDNVIHMPTVGAAVAKLNAIEAKRKIAAGLAARGVPAIIADEPMETLEPSVSFVLDGNMVVPTIDLLLHALREDHGEVAKKHGPVQATVILAAAVAAVSDYTLSQLDDEARAQVKAFGEHLAARIRQASETAQA